MSAVSQIRGRRSYGRYQNPCLIRGCGQDAARGRLHCREHAAHIEAVMALRRLLLRLLGEPS